MILDKLDNFILNRIFHPALNELGKRFGVTAGSAAHSALIITITSDLIGKAINPDLLKPLAIVTIVPLNMICYTYGYAAGKKATRWPNLNYFEYRIMRLCMLIQIVFWFLMEVLEQLYSNLTVNSLIADISIVSFTSVFYFASLPPAPPKKERKSNLVYNPI